MLLERGETMPPIKKFQKEDIIQVGYEIVKREGMDGINARKIAKELNCSVQPIFHNFESMEEVKKAIYEKIEDTYRSYLLSGIKGENPYKAMGMSYIQFAKEEPELFKIRFMQESNLEVERFILSDTIGQDIIKIGQTCTGLSYEEQKKFHAKVWIFTHGIATLVATKTVEFTETEISCLLENTVSEMLKGYKQRKGEEKSEK